MKIVRSIQYQSNTPTVVALGCFDGVHLGHTAVIRAATEQAKTMGLPSLVFAFSEPPRNFFSPGSVAVITEARDKEALIDALGADLCLSVPFDRSVAELSAEEFLETILFHRLRAAHVVCGFNYSFGANGRGNVTLLEDFCRRRGIGFTACPPTLLEGQPVSSSLIRSAIAKGDMPSVRRLLGRNYSILGKVVDGQKLARNLGFPTVNQLLSDRIAVPRHGVYATKIHGASPTGVLFGITNVGLRPTVKGRLLCAETHIFDFSDDLYGKELSVEFLSFLRPEIPFPSLDALKEQVEKDIREARKLGCEGR